MAEGAVEPPGGGTGDQPGDGGWPPELVPLLTLGEEGAWKAEWPDYPARFGLRDEHVPELIRMAVWEPGAEMDDEEFEATPEVWAPMHAWRALGQMGADEAAEPLSELLWQAAEHDLIQTEVPRALGLIGAEAVGPLAELLGEEEADDWTRAAAAEGLRHVAEAHPEARDEAVAPIVLRLGEFAENSPTLNALLISDLMDLKLTAAAPLMEQAIASGAVDISVCGDWEDVQIEMGLLDKRITPRPRYHGGMGLLEEGPVEEDDRGAAARGGSGKKQQRSARKRKLEKASRKRNRKKR